MFHISVVLMVEGKLIREEKTEWTSVREVQEVECKEQSREG